jgi:PGF-CTERM protein
VGVGRGVDLGDVELTRGDGREGEPVGASVGAGAARADDGGVWREDRSWLFRRVEAGGSVAPSVTVAVPADASGSVTVAGNATVGDRTVTDQTTVNVAESGGTATENATSETGTSDGSGPGFGVGIALAAALGLALVIGRSQ